MAQIIQMDNRMIDRCSATWNLTIKETGDSPMIMIIYHESTEQIQYIMHCHTFDQIDRLKDIAEDYTRRHSTDILRGDPITINPAAWQPISTATAAPCRKKQAEAARIRNRGTGGQQLSN